MQKYLAHGMAIMLSIVSLGAAQRPNNSGSEKGQSNQQQATAVVGKSSKEKNHKAKPYQVGTASWYGSYFQGKTTASGEPYNMYDLTAAHEELPLGTLVKVTNLRNGRSVVVRVNDRGPVVAGRIIDVSYNTAKTLDFKARGLQKVRLDIVQPAVVATLQ